MSDGHDEQAVEPLPARPLSDIAIASAKVAAIVEAAERAADELRAKTEQRATERIAEADRAAALRVQAAEDEAIELLDAARAEAAGAHADAEQTVKALAERGARLRNEADSQKLIALQEAGEAAERVRAEAQTEAVELQQAARDDARETVREARVAATEVLREGTELSDNLRALSASLRRNAERLLDDVRAAHTRLTAQLDAAAPTDAAPFVTDARLGEAGEAPAVRRATVRRRGAAGGPDGELDVPEFVPRR